MCTLQSFFLTLFKGVDALIIACFIEETVGARGTVGGALQFVGIEANRFTQNHLSVLSLSEQSQITKIDMLTGVLTVVLIQPPGRGVCRGVW